MLHERKKMDSKDKQISVKEKNPEIGINDGKNNPATTTKIGKIR